MSQPAAYETYLGLYALQHRGQTSCGIAVNSEEADIFCRKGMGTVPEVFGE
ncbi:MAG TPA: amidophosphoribosyltransferase, partial [Clostridiales bacterium]|nr:amidophosphoribosyltransferase [Clostridiales bacterium]